VHRTIPVTGATWFASSSRSPVRGYLVAVGYMDPGNWATDLAGGSRFGYTLLSVILLSNLMAVLLQGLASKLASSPARPRPGVPRPLLAAGLVLPLVLCEIAIAACDLAEVIGTAIALHLLFGIPLTWGICITALDVLLILFLQQRGFRILEALVIVLSPPSAPASCSRSSSRAPTWRPSPRLHPHHADPGVTARCCTSASASSAPR